MQKSLNQKSLRRQLMVEKGSYSDRNDGFNRTFFSDSKAKYSQIRKDGKVKREKPEWKKWS